MIVIETNPGNRGLNKQEFEKMSVPFASAVTHHQRVQNTSGDENYEHKARRLRPHDHTTREVARVPAWVYCEIGQTFECMYSTLRLKEYLILPDDTTSTGGKGEN